jgi:GAF domain-containing protein
VHPVEMEIGKSLDIPASIVEVWQQVVDSLSDLLDIPSVMINRIVPPELEVFLASVGPGSVFPAGARAPLAGVYCEAAARRRSAVRVVDARKDPEWVDSPTAKAGLLAYLGYPLFWPNGEVFGTLCAVDLKENAWGARYENLLQMFKRVIEIHLQLVDTSDHLEKKNKELRRTLEEVKALRGMLPICAACKKVRDDQGYWDRIEDYVTKHSELEFTHSLCPDCAKTLYPQLDI